MVGRTIELVRSMYPEREFPENLEPLLVERIARARATWPRVRIGDDRLVRAIAERLSSEEPGRALESMQTDDLYLACGCAAGGSAALAGFEEHCGSTIERAIATTGASSAERADLGQIVRVRLLVAPAAGGPPRIATYSARGSLRTWVRVVATREAARMLPRTRREVPAGDDRFASMIAGNDDPEIRYLKQLYRDEFKGAFHAAMEALGDRDRMLLRQHGIDGLSIDQLARLHRVHRATAARWIQSAREAALAGTQRELMLRLRLSRGELASVIRLIQSQLDVSLPSALRPSA